MDRDFETSRIPAANPEEVAETPEQAEQLRNEMFAMQLREADSWEGLYEALQSHFERGGAIVNSQNETYTFDGIKTLIEGGNFDYITNNFGLRDKIIELAESTKKEWEDQWKGYFGELAKGVRTRSEFNEKIAAMYSDGQYTAVQGMFEALNANIAALEQKENGGEMIAEMLFPEEYRAVIAVYMRLPKE